MIALIVTGLAAGSVIAIGFIIRVLFLVLAGAFNAVTGNGRG
jgi:hypothetical protein